MNTDTYTKKPCLKRRNGKGTSGRIVLCGAMAPMGTKADTIDIQFGDEMTKHKNRHQFPKPAAMIKNAAGKRIVSSLLDEMADGNEYGSLIDLVPGSMNLADEMRRALTQLESVRQRPVLIYAANMLKQQASDVPLGIVLADDLPFSEMVGKVDPSNLAADIFLVTPGGLAQQVSQFVSRLRPRFSDVAFLLPHMAMSAGTIWALSGNEIWMDDRASLGPIDPQVQGRDGRFLPAQALLTLVEEIRIRGDERLKSGVNPSWTDFQILRNIDAKELGDAVNSSNYSIQLASSYLENYKFQGWVTHSDGTPVLPAERRERAIKVATDLCSHSQWKTHSHGISRDVASSELHMRIGLPESVPGFQSALRRLWALMYWLFDNTNIVKIFMSQGYSLFRMAQGGNK